MKKTFLSLAVFLVLVTGIFASGQAESGRNQASSEVNEGQLLPIGSVDPANYLQDFTFEKSNTSSMPLTFEVDLLHDSIWEKGGDLSVRIALLSNNETFFRTVPGTFIFYFQNPELLSDLSLKNYLYTNLLENNGMDFFFFEPIDATLLRITNETELNSAITRLSGQRKQYANNIGLQGLLSSVEQQFTSERVHVLWITDENIIEKSSDASFFDFSMNVFSSGNTTFSYLGYGEVPNWITLNTGLMKHNGNSYYAQNESELCEKIEKDLAFFSKPAVENITIEIVWSKYVTELANYYPREYYPVIAGFYPTTNNTRPATYHKIGGMNYAESKRFLHYIKIPALQTLIDNSEYREPQNGSNFKVGTVFVNYYVPMYNRSFYQQQDLIINYRNASELSEGHDPYVFCDTVIQNTPLIIQEIANLVNRNYNYLAAIQLVKTQKNLLLKTIQIRKDRAVNEDIELLEKYYKLLFEQAKTMNLLQ